MEREKATEDRDLPHAYDAQGDVCACGRPERHPLHDPATPERASSGLPRETGS